MDEIEIGVCIIGVHFMFSDIMVVVQQMASATIFVKSPWESFEWILSDLRGFLTVCLSCSALPKFYAADYKAFLFPYDPLQNFELALFLI